jgi:hypothetical protein
VTDSKKGDFNRYEAESLMPKTYDDDLMKKMNEEEMRKSF